MKQMPQPLGAQSCQGVLDPNRATQTDHVLRGVRPLDALQRASSLPHQTVLLFSCCITALEPGFVVQASIVGRFVPLVRSGPVLQRSTYGSWQDTGRESEMLNTQDIVTITGPQVRGSQTVFTREAMEFVGELAHEFESRRRQLLALRQRRQADLDSGYLPDFLPETEEIRKSDWKVAPIPRDLVDRRVEITGPVDRKMIINALNSGANVFMADFEDANSPTWRNNVEGQINVRDAVNGTITYTSPEGKEYGLNSVTATLMVRPRGWHLVEQHYLVEGEPVAAALFDFGLFFFHNARTLMRKGSGPFFYLPKLEHHLEARLWNDVFLFAQDYLNIPRGTIRATVLIETLPAAFQMHEILYELREHSAGLNCGRWDYIFSFIKKFRNHPDFVLPDRSEITMDRHFLDCYVRLLIETCHRRGIHAMGGMAAQIPIKNDANANQKALDRVRQRQSARSVRRPRRYVGGSSCPGAAGQRGFRCPHEGA